MYREGARWADIVAVTGISKPVVQRELRRRRVPVRARVHLPRDEIVAAYLAGASENELTSRYAVARRTMARYLDMWNVPRRSQAEACGAWRRART